MVSPEYIVDAHLSWIPVGSKDLRHDPIEHLQVSGISGAILIQPLHDFDESMKAVKYASENPLILGVMPWVDFSSPSFLKQITELKNYSKVRGTALTMEREDNHWLTEPQVIENLKNIAKLGWSVDLRVEPRQLPSVKTAATEIPSLRFGLAHMGSPYIGKSEREPWGVFMLNIAPLPNVFVKASGLVTLDSSPWNASHIKLFVEPVVRMFGYKRIMFGSDWPVYMDVASFDDIVDTTVRAASPMTEEQQLRIFGGTAREFYRL